MACTFRGGGGADLAGHTKSHMCGACTSRKKNKKLVALSQVYCGWRIVGGGTETERPERIDVLAQTVKHPQVIKILTGTL